MLKYSAHARRKGPGRSAKVRFTQTLSGAKVEKQAREGVCGLRGRKVYGAGRLALERKLGKEYKRSEEARRLMTEGS